MARVLTIDGELFVQGTATCFWPVPGVGKRTKRCGKRFKFIIPMPLALTYIGSSHSPACPEHGDWVGKNEEIFSADGAKTVRLLSTESGLVIQ